MGNIVPITTVEIPMSVNNSWTEVDVSGYGVPAAATGLIIHVIRHTASITDYSFGLRKKGSTDNRTNGTGWGTGSAGYACHFWAFVGLDDALKFEYYVGEYNKYNLYITAYTTTGITFLTNGIEKTAGEDVWLDMDCSAQAPSAIGLIFEITGEGTTAPHWGIRKNGSTDDHKYRQGLHGWAMIGCDGSQVAEGYKNESTTKFFIIGYITAGVTFNTNGNLIASPGGVAQSWITTDLETEVPSSYLIIVECRNPGDVYGMRKYGETGEDLAIYSASNAHPWVVCAVDVQHRIQIWEFYSAPQSDDYYIIAYCDAEDAEVNTETATLNSQTSANLIGYLVDDGGITCDVDFEYGLTDSYGSDTTDTEADTGDWFSHTVTGLSADTLYHYRARAVNQKGTFYGEDKTFRTSFAVTYELFIEVALNQSILTESPNWTDISNFCQQMSTKRGRNHILDKVETGTAIVVLDNKDGDFYRYNSDSSYYPYFTPLTLLRIYATHNSVTYYLFYGTIESIGQDWIQRAGGYAGISNVACTDMFKTFSRKKLLALQGTVGDYTNVGGLKANAASGQKDVDIYSLLDDSDKGIDISRLHVGQSLTIGDDNNSETNTIASIDTVAYILTMTNNLTNTYSTGDNAYIKKFPSALSSVRISDICYEIGWPSGLTDIDTGEITISELVPPTGGTNALLHMQKVAEAEGGLVYQTGQGILTFENLTARQASPLNTSQATFSDESGNKYIFPKLIDDDSLIYNEARISNKSTGLLEQGYIDSDAQDLQGPKDLIISDSLIENESDAFDRCYTLVKRLSSSMVRVEELQIAPDGDPANLFPKVFGYELSTRITLGLTGTRNPAGLLKEYHIEGVSHNWSASTWHWLTSWQLWDVNQFVIVQASHDGYLQKSDTDYDTCHDAANADSPPYNDEGAFAIGQWNEGGGLDNLYYIWRAFLQFDTSGISADDTIASAAIIFQVYGYYVIDNEFNITLVSGDDLANPLVVADYGDLLDDTTSLGSVTVYSPEINTQYLVIELNSTGIAAINQGGTTKFGIRSSNDISDTAPWEVTDDTAEFLLLNGVGSAFVPRLIVQISEAT